MPNWTWQEPKNSPYHFQRERNAIHSDYPRPPQANTNQPNRKSKPSGMGMTTRDYWSGVQANYLKRRK